MYTLQEESPTVKTRPARSLGERTTERQAAAHPSGRGVKPAVPKAQCRTASSSSSGTATRGSVARQAKPRRITSADENYGSGRGYADAPPQRKTRGVVEYTPHTFTEYQAVCQPGNWEQLGKLGPDLQDEDLIEKRAQKERIKEYSRNLRAQNAQAIDYTKHMKQMEFQEPKAAPAPAPSKREKMASYAASVPKPKPKKTVNSFDKHEAGFDVNGPMSALEELEAKHKQDQLMVAAIRKEMAMH